MSDYQGFSNLQATQIDSIQVGVTGLQALANQTSADLSSYITSNNGIVSGLTNSYNALNSDFNSYVSSNNATIAGITGAFNTYKTDNDAELTNLTTTVTNNRTLFDAFVNQTTGPTGSIPALVSTFQTNRADFDFFVQQTDAQIGTLESNYTALTNRVDTLETGVTGIQNQINTTITDLINSKVADTTFESLKTQLEDKDSELFASLATKVAKTVQVPVDTEQATKINHLIDFVNVFLQTYTITDQNNTPYTFTTPKITVAGEGYFGVNLSFNDSNNLKLSGLIPTLTSDNNTIQLYLVLNNGTPNPATDVSVTGFDLTTAVSGIITTTYTKTNLLSYPSDNSLTGTATGLYVVKTASGVKTIVSNVLSLA